MNRARGKEPGARIDWLPWGLSIFGACCAVFVLVRGVLPERAVNRELVQRVTRLESDLTRTRQDAIVDLTRVKDQLEQQTLTARAEVSAIREQERLHTVREAALRDLAQSLALEIGARDVLLQERGSELAVVIRERLMFYGASSLIESKGKRFLRQVAASIHRLPPDQVYRITAQTERQARSIARYLEVTGRVPRAQLVTGGVPAASRASSGRAGGTVEIVLASPKR
ncbi:MAG TPA: hypothetical protein VNN80_20890 [Polyangiaceae bacterium]|jgi:hypothetical protein|nr:hypothetical protein [Polyangiaceae bacterium]